MSDESELGEWPEPLRPALFLSAGMVLTFVAVNFTLLADAVVALLTATWTSTVAVFSVLWGEVSALSVGVTVWSVGGWLLYFRERGRSRDYVADLAQLIHDHELGRDDLRRSLGWDEVEARLEDEDADR